MINSRLALGFLASFLVLIVFSIMLTGAKHAKAVKVSNEMRIRQDSITLHTANQMDSVVHSLESNLPVDAPITLKEDVSALKQQIKLLK